jgi:hypothetical protein
LNIKSHVFAVAVGHMDGTDFAAALERCIARSKSPPPPAALLPAPEQHPASELKGLPPVERLASVKS